MCRSAHNRKTVAIPRGSAGASDLDPSSSSSTSPTVAPQNDALVALGAVFLLLAMGFSALGSDPCRSTRALCGQTARWAGWYDWPARGGTSAFYRQASSSLWLGSRQS